MPPSKQNRMRCQCGRDGCARYLTIWSDQYETARAQHPAALVVAPEHALLLRVLLIGDGFAAVRPKAAAVAAVD